MITNTKFKNLEAVSLFNIKFNIPKLLSISVYEYLKNPLLIINNGLKLLRSDLLAIRSSAADEDGQTSSSAGEYASALNIPSNNSEKITEAINTVIASYERKRPLLPNDEVIIQEMLQDITMSGVIFPPVSAYMSAQLSE